MVTIRVQDYTSLDKVRMMRWLSERCAGVDEYAFVMDGLETLPSGDLQFYPACAFEDTVAPVVLTEFTLKWGV